MSRVIRIEQFPPVERDSFFEALESAGHNPARFDVSKIEISPPLMPGNVTALVTVQLASSAIACSYEDAPASNWVAAFVDDLAAGRFGLSDRGRPRQA